MATINGYTAEKMQEIADAAIDTAEVVGDDLVLHLKGGASINVGSVRGFPGISDMTLYDPPGVPKPYTGAAAPTGYGLCDAQTEFDGATYPALAALYGTGVGCVNGASTTGKFRLPDLRGKSLVGLHSGITAFDTLHKTGGSKDAVAVSHNHNHNHGVTDPGHSHSFVGGQTFDPAARIKVDNVVADNTLTSSAEGTGISIQNDATNAGVSGTDKNLPPYRVVNYIMRLA